MAESQGKCAVGIQTPPYLKWYPEHLPTDAKYKDLPAKSCLRCGAWLEKEST